MRAPPVLATERLILSPPEPSDLDESLTLWGNPDAMAFIGDGQPLSAEDVWSRLLRQAGVWAWCGFGYWTVRLRADGRYVGTVGFQDLKRALEPDLGGLPEIGWLLVPAMQGRGLAREAVAAALAWADRHLAAHETACIVRPTHARSLRLAAAVGYAPVRSAIYRGAPIEVLVRPRAFQSDAPHPTS